jgi:hypothetical protein
MKLKDFIKACNIYAKMNIREDININATRHVVAEYFGGCVSDDGDSMKIDLCANCLDFENPGECPCNLWEYVAGFVLEMLTPKILLTHGQSMLCGARSAME